jgi:DNA-binding SARP family transcriptional activator
MTHGFRFEPTAVRHGDVIDRARIIRLLNQRFDHRVTTVIAEAGFGKSTALALAVENNRLDPIGRDVWLAADRDDGRPDHFVGGLATALGIDQSTVDDGRLERIIDAIWSQAPTDVAIVIDDAHRLDGTASMQVLAELLSRLPANGHLVLAGRSTPDIPLARLRAHGELLEIDERNLEFDDDELARLRQLRRQHDAMSLPRHAATADLRLAAGLDAGAAFLWEEILASYDTDRLTALRRVAVLDELDDELVDAITDGAFDCATLLAGTPLVERSDDGTHRLHDILREALIARLEPGERRKTLAIAADTERRRERFPRAVELYDESGDPIGALETARAFALAPTMLQTLDAVHTTRRIARGIDPDAAVCKVLDAISRFAGLEGQLAAMFLEAGAAARADGDDELEALAMYRAAQTQLLHHADDYWATYDRIVELAEHNEFAAGVEAYLSSIHHQLDGDADAALAALDRIHGLGRSTELVARAERLYDLARPELVAVGLTSDDVAHLTPGATAFIGISIWIRGDSSPDASAAAVSDSIERTLRQGFTHPAVSTLGTGALIALAAGHDDVARRYAEHAADLARSGVGQSILEVVIVARAAVAAVLDGDAAASAILAERQPHPQYVDEHNNWPSRAHLAALTMVYVCQPSLRPMLDRVDLGSAGSAAVAAGRAVIALREHDDAAPAADLPWHQVDLLRANVLPTHLAELACAAMSVGSEAAADVLHALPHERRLLQRVVEVSGRSAARVAADVLGDIPQAEPFRLDITTLGPVELHRDGQPVTAPEIVKRPKVRELLGLLAERRRVDRREIIDLLWPEHDDERALANLRTTLSTLNNALEPDRARGTSAFHLAIDGESVVLDDRVGHDVVEFERLVEAARADDRSGLPARALDTYVAAIDIYRGDYLAGFDVSWVVLTRLRLRSLAVTTLCRIAELVAARGEPEQAARWAGQAREIDPLNERAGRQFVAALEASGDRSAARTAMRSLVDTLDDADIVPDAATVRLAARLG